MEFNRTTLGEICTKIGSGSTPRGGKESYCTSGTALIRSQNILDFNFSPDGLAYLNAAQAKQLDNVKLIQGDILLNITGDSVARCCQLDSDYLPARVNQHVSIIRGDSKFVLNSFLLYFLQFKKLYLWQLASAGATRNALTKSMLESMEILLPPLYIQERITKILNTLQNKITINKKIIENLEKQAQAIYKDFFSDAKNSSYNGTLHDICIYSSQKVPVSILNKNNYFSTENILPNKAGATSASSLPAITQTTACEKGDTLISNIRPYFKKVLFCFENCGCSNDVLCFHPLKSSYASYLFNTLCTDSFFNYVMSGVKGTKMPRGDKKQIMNYPIVIPENDEIIRYNKITNPILKAIQYNRLEESKLSSLRDIILPKLMSGEINI